MAEALLVLALAAALAVPLGGYLARVLQGRDSLLDPVALPVERLACRLMGVDPARGMTWWAYSKALLLSNVVLGLFAWLLFLLQGRLPANPDGVAGMSWHLALHSALSFVTNTNQQHYSGQAQLSHLSQTLGVTALQVATPLMGLCMAAATLRGLAGGRAPGGRPGGTVDVGNYWSDLVRLLVRVMLPLGLVLALALAWQGVPATWRGAAVAAPLSAPEDEQRLPLGPVAPMLAAKQLGTNGGGWYGPNSSAPYENPTPLSNLLEMVALLVLPMACAVMAGPLTGRRRFGGFVFATMGVMSLALVLLASGGETSVPAHALEGRELRFGPASSALWATLTTQTSNGSVNSMLDSAQPTTMAVALLGMLVNSVWGGVGCGLVNFLVVLLVTLFLCGLMIGRTPELFGRKIEVAEVRLLAATLLLQPVVVLVLTATALAFPSLTGHSNPGFHGLAQVLYEYTSAFANNGSGLEGLGDATPWWNLSCSAALLLGRYPSLVLPLAVAASLGGKRAAPAGSGTLEVESATFGLALVGATVLLQVLQFLPSLVLGPIGEALELSARAAGGAP